jgi:Pvc16 N-terminal domain
MPPSSSQHHIIKEAGDTIARLFLTIFRENGYKRIQVVNAAPKDEEVSGKMPALGVYLHTVSIEDESMTNRTASYVETEISADGKVTEVARQLPIWMRLFYLVSVWAQSPEEECLLLGAAVKGLLEHPVVRGEDLVGTSFDADFVMPVTLSSNLDDSMLANFWGSLSQPMRPAIQCWTMIPIYPTTGTEIKRVQEKEVRFFDLNKLNRIKR